MYTLDRYTLRPADNNDFEKVWNLIYSCLAQYGLLMDSLTIDKDLLDIQGNYWDAGGVFYVLLDEDRVIGTVALHYESKGLYELCRMYLLEEYRGQGLGRGMLQFAVEQAKSRGSTEIYLKTASVLKEAIALYKKSGFVIEAETDVGGNCDVMMRMRL
jgi:putative acetyltransferase